MKTPNLGAIIANIFEEVMEDSPDPFNIPPSLHHFFGLPRVSYRDQLTYPYRNYKGELIPRGRVVRRHLKTFRVRFDPARLR